MFVIVIAKFLIYNKLYEFTDAMSISTPPEAKMTTNEIITYHGYPCELHTVTTNDGYILEMHRIPGGKTANHSGNDFKRVVFLQHGFIGSSAVWVTNLPNQSAAFVFADAGFDVWLGNFRGNTYSTKHVNYTQNDLKYWEFTFDEFARYDLEAMINYVLNKTGQCSLNYIGYSEGTLAMFVKLSTDQLFAQKLRRFFALGPVGALTHIKGLVKSGAKNFLQSLKALAKFTGKFMPHKSVFQKISKTVCSIRRIVEHCENFMFQITGPATVQMNVSRIPVYMSHLPAGTSIANVIHWLQMMISRKMQMYDYGSESENMKHYNMKTPPLYNFSLINAPLYLYWSDQDWLADQRDIQDGLIAKISKKYLVQNNELKNFNHFDFIWGLHAADQIYKPIVKIIKDDDDDKTIQANSHHPC